LYTYYTDIYKYSLPLCVCCNTYTFINVLWPRVGRNNLFTHRNTLCVCVCVLFIFFFLFFFWTRRLQWVSWNIIFLLCGTSTTGTQRWWVILIYFYESNVILHRDVCRSTCIYSVDVKKTSLPTAGPPRGCFFFSLQYYTVTRAFGSDKNVHYFTGTKNI